MWNKWGERKRAHKISINNAVQIRNDLFQIRIQLRIFRVPDPDPNANPDPTHIIEANLEIIKKTP